MLLWVCVCAEAASRVLQRAPATTSHALTGPRPSHTIFSEGGRIPVHVLMDDDRVTMWLWGAKCVEPDDLRLPMRFIPDLVWVEEEEGVVSALTVVCHIIRRGERLWYRQTAAEGKLMINLIKHVPIRFSASVSSVFSVLMFKTAAVGSYRVIWGLYTVVEFTSFFLCESTETMAPWKYSTSSNQTLLSKPYVKISK